MTSAAHQVNTSSVIEFYAYGVSFFVSARLSLNAHVSIFTQRYIRKSQAAVLRTTPHLEFDGWSCAVDLGAELKALSFLVRSRVVGLQTGVKHACLNGRRRRKYNIE